MSDATREERLYYTISEAARICRLSPLTLVKLANAGILSCWRVPSISGHRGHRRFNREDLIDFAVRCKLSHVIDELGDPAPARPSPAANGNGNGNGNGRPSEVARGSVGRGS